MSVATWPSFAVAVLALAVAACAEGQSPPSKGDMKPRFALAIGSPHDAGASGGAVLVEIAMTNTSDHTIIVHGYRGDGAAALTYGIDVRDMNGAPAAILKARSGSSKGEELRFQEYVGGSLGPGQTVKDVVDISKIYDLRPGGRYTIRVQRTDEMTKGVAKSNALTVAVKE
jgi:hypothetical protein